MPRRPRLPLLALGVAVLLSSCGAAPGAPRDPVVGTASNGLTGAAERFVFTPREVRDGDGEVEFRNDTKAPHNVIFDDPRVQDSPLMKQGDTYVVQLPEPGTYRYVCTLHPGMDGSVLWQDS